VNCNVPDGEQCLTMTRPPKDSRSRVAGLRAFTYALLVLMGFSAEPLFAQPFRLQTAPPASPSPEAKRSFQAKIQEQARALGTQPPFNRLSPQRQQALLESIIGNMLFVATHEIGRAVMSEFEVPAVTGIEETADDFAVLTILKHGERDFSDRVLIEAAKGWFMSGQRGKRGKTPDYYTQHRFSERRGTRIACLVIGADPVRFKALAEETKLPKERQRRCGWDYDRATLSWEKVLAPYRRAADQPKAQIEVIYGAASGVLQAYAQAFRKLRFLEIVAELAADRFAWRSPIAIDMRSCGEAAGGWIIAERRLHLCYEMARNFAELYRDLPQDQ